MRIGIYHQTDGTYECRICEEMIGSKTLFINHVKDRHPIGDRNELVFEDDGAWVVTK